MVVEYFFNIYIDSIIDACNTRVLMSLIKPKLNLWPSIFESSLHYFRYRKLILGNNCANLLPQFILMCL